MLEDTPTRKRTIWAGDDGTFDEIDLERGIVVPITLPNGERVGSLCATRRDAMPYTDVRDAGILRFVAELIGDEIATDHQALQSMAPKLDDVVYVAALLEAPIEMAYQPILHLESGRVVGYEALARFNGSDPEAVFSSAWRVGLGPDLELAAIEAALHGLAEIPGDAWLSINAAPMTILTEGFARRLDRVESKRIVVEITENAAIIDYAAMITALEALLDRGVRLAIDDVGVGYSSLGHIMELSPDILKLDVMFTRGIERDPVRRAATQALASFARDVDALLVAEAIETGEERRALRRLGVEYGQGFHLGLPTSLPPAA